MEINFRLNDRNSNQLSDRIIDSGDYIFKDFLCDDLVQNFLMKGEMTNHNRDRVMRRLRDVISFGDNSFAVQAFKDLKELANEESEKQFLDMLVSGIIATTETYSKKNQLLFGKLDPKLRDEMKSMSFTGQKLQIVSQCHNGPFLRGVVAVYGLILFDERVHDYLKSNPNYTENNLAKMFLFEDFKLQPALDTLRQMIDSKEDQVSDAEEKELAHIFQRTIAGEGLIMKHSYKQIKWFEG